MARVPDYSQRQVGIRPVGTPGFSMRAPDASGLARGLEQAENALLRHVEKERENANRAALLEADKQLTDWQHATLFNPESGVYTRKGKNALDVTNATLAQFEEAQSKIASGLSSDEQRTQFSQIAAQRRESISRELNRYEYGERQRYYDDVDRGQLETALQGAALNYNNPDKIAYYQRSAQQVLRAQAERKGLPEEMLQANLLEASSGMATAVISRMVSDDPGRAKQYFEAAQGQMTADDQVSVTRLIEREIKSREIEARQMQAIARAELSSRVSDAQSAYLSGYDFDNPPSQSDFVASYGAEEGAERYQQFAKTQQLGSAIREIAMASPEERSQIIDRFNPAKDGVAGEGFAADAKLYGTLVNTASRLTDELQKDPAQFVASRSPLIQRAAQQAQDGDPAAVEAYATAMIAEQRRLGAPEPKLLTSRQAASIAAAFESTEDGGSNAAQIIEGLQQQWGKNWPTVYKQLQDKLPGAALVIGSGVDPQTSATLARIAPLKTSELKVGLDPAEVKGARDALSEGMAEFRNTLAGQVGGERTFATLYSEAERLAYAYMGQGKAPQDAVEQATKALIDDKYTLKGSYRVPKAYDADLVEAGAERAIAQLDPGTLAFAIPAGVGEDFAKERVKSAIERDGYWVTAPDESGLALYYGGEAVLDKSGAPVIRSFDDLATEAVRPAIERDTNAPSAEPRDYSNVRWGQ
ncbi:hypothetical protein JQR85_13515 [Stutzerimonas urumqiensis]|uniref:hypothetical protein n=1 Tax=Stutzerimonas urumqiensis TaxID=638269 RepID=UPI003DA6B459